MTATTAAALRQERSSARDFVRCATTVAAFICLVMIRIMPRRLSANVSL
jgi:hypothetical protein